MTDARLLALMSKVAAAGGCRLLVADPPWRFSDKLPGPGRGAAKHYPTLDAARIEMFPLPPLADDCALFLWRVAAMQEEALAVARAWGFAPKTELVWEKKTVGGKEAFGMGRILRAAHETCIVATRGRPEVCDRSIRSRFSAPVGRHSEKPNEFFGLVERLYSSVPSDQRVEMFARRPRLGWVCLGDEL